MDAARFGMPFAQGRREWLRILDQAVGRFAPLKSRFARTRHGVIH